MRFQLTCTIGKFSPLRLSLSFLLFCFLLWPLLAAAQSSSTPSPLLTSQHKFKPQGKKSHISPKAAKSSHKTKKHAVKKPRSKSNRKSVQASRSSRKVVRQVARRPVLLGTDAYSVLSRKISAKSAFAMDGNGKIIFALSADTPMQPASTIKILTGFIAIKNLDDKDLVPVSKKASMMPRSKIYLQPGRLYRADDLINGVLLSSANDASVALAEKISGSEAAFAQKMTATAIGLGAKNTICKTANGLTTRGQESTARDLATIFQHAMNNQEFAARIGRTKVRTSYGAVLMNHNKALWKVNGAMGGKTGYTQAARQTYVGMFSRGNSDLFVSVMGSETMWSDISHLVEYGFAQLERSRKANIAVTPTPASEKLELVAFDDGRSRLQPLVLLRDSKKVAKL